MEKLSESFLLLALHPDKARYIVSTQKLNVGLQGSILMDLFFEEKIDLEGKRVNLKSNRASSGSVEAEMLHRISKAKKPPRIKNLVSNDSFKGRKLRFRLFEGMQSKGLVKVESRKFWIIPYKLVRIADQKARQKLIERLKHSLKNSADIPEKDTALLSLIYACRIYRVLGREPEELRENKRKLKSIAQGNQISQSVYKALHEMEAAIASTVAVTAVTGASG